MPDAAVAKPPLKVLLATPRGFCAGVDRAIQIVERAIEKYGAPVYVRHEIVHNRHVVDRLKAMGAVFVEELEECPPDRPVVFSAHGVPKSVPAEAKARKMLYLDATCPLVSKVHVEAQRHFDAGREIVLIGHAGHPEVVGTMGQLPDGEGEFMGAEGGSEDAFYHKLSQPVSELELSVRSANCLSEARIKTIGELVSRSEAEMLKYRNFGKKSLNEISDILKTMGLHFGMQLDPKRIKNFAEQA